MSKPLALVVRAPGTNRDGDAAFALELAGAEARRVLINEVFADPKLLREARMLVIPGGFSFADALGAGRLFALEIVTRLRDELTTFVEAGKPVIGICNGFQVLVRTGLLPGDGLTVALGGNRIDGKPDGQFICDWVRLQPVSQKCIWTTTLTADVECPIAHGEGRFVCDPDTMATLVADDQIAFRYATPNPNGSMADVAGICDSTGLVLGLMPHPEDHVLPRQHPQYLRHHRGGLGRAMLEAGVNHAKDI
ncbi:MAG: purQ [Acidimicrobiales bacterium]|nr:purQ [Acidimicrobiales bacterium]